MENWRRETEKFTPGTKTLIHHGIKRSRGNIFTDGGLEDTLVISSYSLLHRDSALFSKIEWAGVILDEAQNIKNPDTYQSRAARALKADWHVALTGTPVENHVGDMWSLMEFLMPGLMPNRARFAREILRPVQAGEKKAMDRVRRMTAPFILRRLKTDKEIIDDLPEKIETKEFCTLSREQASLYSAVTTALTQELEGTEGIKRKGVVLGAITALKQICDHPLLYVKDKSDYKNRSGKMARLAEIAEEMLAAGDRALIFTQYAEMGAILKKFLQEMFGREALFLHGGVPREKRDEMVRRFQEDENAPPFFILSLKAGGTGLNLTRANHVVMFDRWWNPAVEQQAVDRAYRIGQRSNVQVHYFCCRGTLEEKIEALIESKKELASMLVGTGESWLTEMSDSDLTSSSRSKKRRWKAYDAVRTRRKILPLQKTARNALRHKVAHRARTRLRHELVVAPLGHRHRTVHRRRPHIARKKLRAPRPGRQHLHRAGLVTAFVQGTRKTPYQIRLGFETVTPDARELILFRFRERAAFTAQLLAGEMPDEIEQIFKESGTPLFPNKNTLRRFKCSCPDDPTPCKHIIAVLLLLGEELEDDPFILLRLRGLDKESLINLLTLESPRDDGPLPIDEDDAEPWSAEAGEEPESVTGGAETPEEDESAAVSEEPPQPGESWFAAGDFTFEQPEADRHAPRRRPRRNERLPLLARRTPLPPNARPLLRTSRHLRGRNPNRRKEKTRRQAEEADIENLQAAHCGHIKIPVREGGDFSYLYAARFTAAGRPRILGGRRSSRR